MILDTDTFYVVANIGGGYMKPTFAKDIGRGITDAWGSCDTAERFDTRKEANAFIREEFPDNKEQYKPMRVRIDVRLYN